MFEKKPISKETFDEHIETINQSTRAISSLVQSYRTIANNPSSKIIIQTTKIYDATQMMEDIFKNHHSISKDDLKTVKEQTDDIVNATDKIISVCDAYKGIKDNPTSKINEFVLLIKKTVKKLK